MNKKVTLGEMYEVMAEMLESGGEVNFNSRGTSMLPMLHSDGDRVIIVKPKGELKKYDIPLYKRADGSFVLHRIVRKPKNMTYQICGDNQWDIEKNVLHSQVIGVVTHFFRNNKKISCDNRIYKIYCIIWVAIMPIRKLVIGGKRKIKAVILKK